MANVVLGGVSLKSTAASSSQPAADTLNEIATCAARFVRGENDPHVVSIAEKGVLKGIDEINMRHLFDFGRKSATDITLVDGDDSYALPNDFLAVSEVQLVDASTADPKIKLDHLDWEVFSRENPRQTSTGTPEIWTDKNSFDDEVLLVYPVPTASTASSYKLRITYFERVNAPASPDALVVAPKELNEVLCLFAEAYLVDVLQPNVEARARRKWVQARDALNAFAFSRKRKPDEIKRFRLNLTPGGSNVYRSGRQTIKYVKD